MDPDPLDAQMLDFYEQTAPVYDTWAGGVNARAAARLGELAAVLPEERAIDIGCGTGGTTHLLAGRTDAGGSSIGVDVSQQMLDVAERKRTHASNAQFHRMDLRRPILRAASFDVVILGQLLPYFSDPRVVLLEAHRLLRPSGRLSVSCQCLSLCTAAQTLFFEKLEDFPFRVTRGPEQQSPLGEPAVLSETLREAGFDHVETTQLMIGNRAADAAAWVDLMMLAGPWPYALLRHLLPAGRERFEQRLDGAMRDLGEGAFAYHTAFTFAVAQRV